MGVGIGVGGYFGDLQLKNDGGAVWIKIYRHGATILIAEDGGAQAESETRSFSDGVGADIGVKGAVGAQKAGPGVGNKNLHHVALTSGLKANVFGRHGSTSARATGNRFLAFDCLDGELQAMQNRLAQGLSATQHFGQRRRHIDAEVDGTLEKLRTMEFFHVCEQFRDG